MSLFDPYRKASPIGFWTIAGAVCVGVLIAHAVELIVAAAAARVTLQWASMEFEKNTKQAQAEAGERARQNAERAERIRQQQVAAQMAADESSAKAERERQRAAEKREAAWKAYYKRDPACDDNPSTETFTRCANEHLRAKTQFAATYKP